MEIVFNGLEHQLTYEFWINAVTCPDAYHQALLYTLAICPDTRLRIGQIYDSIERTIDSAALEGGWQTSTSRRVCLLAFNLFNGFIDPNCPQASAPYDIFCCCYARYFLQAIKLRYAEYFCN